MSTHTSFATPRSTDPVQDVIDVLSLRPLGGDRFVVQPKAFGRQRLFGGQVFAQATAAASLTSGDRLPHSLHACFLLPGSPDHPLYLEVERTRDGGAFSSRRVQALQDGKVILTMLASFHRQETGFEHQEPMPAVPEPDALRNSSQLLAEHAARTGEQPHPMLENSLSNRMGMEIRPVEPESLLAAFQGPPRYAHWLRFIRPVADDPRLHCWLLAFASDMAFLGTSLRPHGQPWYSATLQPSTIDHALWIHRPFRADDWLLFVTESPSAHAARGFVRGTLYDRGGRLIASAAQEGLIRPIRG
jgi:acyl-CoA thioesterase-2